MWSLLPRQAQVGIIVFVTLLVATSLGPLFCTATGRSMSLIRLTSPIALLIGMGFTTVVGLTWRWLWRKIPALGRRVFPDLNGRWEGTLHSNWTDPVRGAVIRPVPATVKIYQGLFSVVVRMKTSEATSVSTRAFLVPFREAGLFRIWYAYDNRPNAQVRARSHPHEGVAHLDLELAAPGWLAGRYYTDRGTMGDLELSLANTNPDSAG